MVLVEDMFSKMIHYFFFQGAFYGIVICGFKNLRVFAGPLPMAVCRTQLYLTAVTLWSIITIIGFVAFAKFMYICVWKSIRELNEKLLSRIALLIALLVGFLIGLPVVIYNVDNLQACISIYILKDFCPKLTFLLGEISKNILFCMYNVQLKSRAVAHLN